MAWLTLSGKTGTIIINTDHIVAMFPKTDGEFKTFIRTAMTSAGNTPGIEVKEDLKDICRTMERLGEKGAHPEPA